MTVAYFITDSIAIDATAEHYPAILSKLMKWTMLTDIEGGTGYAMYTPTFNLPFTDRVPAAIAAAPDVVFLEGGFNDVNILGLTPSALEAVVSSVIAALRAGLPNATIYVLGPWYYAAPTTTYINANVAMKSAVLAAHSPKVIFLDNQINTSGSSWINDSNKATYIGIDFVHLLPGLGHIYFANRIYEAIVALEEHEVIGMLSLSIPQDIPVQLIPSNLTFFTIPTMPDEDANKPLALNFTVPENWDGITDLVLKTYWLAGATGLVDLEAQISYCDMTDESAEVVLQAFANANLTWAGVNKSKVNTLTIAVVNLAVGRTFTVTFRRNTGDANTGIVYYKGCKASTIVTATVDDGAVVSFGDAVAFAG